MIRDVLLATYGAAWLFVVVMTQVRTGTVPAELWAALGLGVGGILAVFRVDGSDKRGEGDGRGNLPTHRSNGRVRDGRRREGTSRAGRQERADGDEDGS